VFPRDKVFLRNISVDTLHKGDTEDGDDDNNSNNNNNNNKVQFQFLLLTYRVNSQMADYINIIIYRNKLTQGNKQDINEKTTNIKEEH
jgi:hypothetical protein